ncbi:MULTISPECIES: hypothetical protein [Protofrankia]|uniref:hypothetical protein n=1 Tax=Protofrankia TaxID=2994361 RepID=UPI000699E189|nr:MULTISPECIES: hypothetical protein [Protofrankia]ONH34271.1 hypothetical protein BL254_17285 [Protofrankia sp. BMG5.30]
MTKSSTDALNTALTALDEAASTEEADQARGLIGRLLDARAARTAERLDREANAERLRELEALRAEIISHAGDADEIVNRLDVAVEATAALVEAVVARQELHGQWQAALSRHGVGQCDTCAPLDAGLGAAPAGYSHRAIAVDRRQINYLEPGDLLGVLLHMLSHRVPAGTNLTPANVGPSNNQAFAADPAGYIRRIMGAGLREAG